MVVHVRCPRHAVYYVRAKTATFPINTKYARCGIGNGGWVGLSGHTNRQAPPTALRGVNIDICVIAVLWGPQHSPCQHWCVFSHNLKFLAACSGWRAQAQQVHGHQLYVFHPTHSMGEQVHGHPPRVMNIHWGFNLKLNWIDDECWMIK